MARIPIRYLRIVPTNPPNPTMIIAFIYFVMILEECFRYPNLMVTIIPLDIINLKMTKNQPNVVLDPEKTFQTLVQIAHSEFVGLGGRFPKGYPVATIGRINFSDGDRFLAIEALPVASLEDIRYLLLVSPNKSQAAPIEQFPQYKPFQLDSKQEAEEPVSIPSPLVIK